MASENLPELLIREGELTDAAVAIDWLQEHNSNNVPIWVVGFSFGAWVAMQLTMRRPEIVSFVALSLPATKYDFSFLSPCPVPGLIIQSMIFKKQIKKMLLSSDNRNAIHQILDDKNFYVT